MTFLDILSFGFYCPVVNHSHLLHPLSSLGKPSHYFISDSVSAFQN